MITFYKSDKRKLLETQECSPGCWVHVTNPSESEASYLVEHFNLDRDQIIDAVDIYEVPRVDEERNVVYIYLRVPTSRIEEESTSSFMIAITKNNVITISNDNLGIFDAIRNSKKVINTSDRALFIARFLTFISVLFSSNVRRILKEVKKDKKRLSNLSDSDIRDLVLQEDILNEYLSSFAPLADIHNRILKIKSFKLGLETKEIIEDTLVDLQQTFNLCKSALKGISNTRDYYSTTISNKLNKIITVLTVFTIFLTVPAVVAGIYGMNIALPLQSYPGAFFALIAVVVVIWAIMFSILRWRKII